MHRLGSRYLGRKGYYFIIDAFIGSLVIFVSLMVILNSRVNIPKVQDNYGIAEDYNTFIINSRLEDLHNDYIITLMDDGITPHTQNTIIEQVTEFHYLRSQCSNNTCREYYMNYSTGLIQNITDPMLPEKYGFSYSLIDNNNVTLIYNRSIDTLNSSHMIIASRKISFLQLDSNTLVGPVISEIKIWV